MKKLTALTMTAILATAAVAQMSQNEYLAREFQSAGEHMGYRLLLPKPLEQGKKYPVVLFLHGAGERGSDNAKQLNRCLDQFAASANRAKYPCFVIAPQCPEGKAWINIPDLTPEQQRDARRLTLALVQSEQPSDSMRLALSILDAVESEYAGNIDLNRVYISGISMGGLGTWDAITRYPERFAAAIPICGGGDAKKITPAVAKIPIWAFHAEDDNLVPVVYTRNMIAALKAAGGEPKYTEYPAAEKVGHASWVPAYKMPELFEWLFAQERK